MEANTEILELWGKYAQQLQNVIKVNQAQAIALLQLKLSFGLKKLRPIKWLGVLGGIIWIGCGVAVLEFVFKDTSMSGQGVNYFFVISYGLQLIITAWATVMYLYHLRLIYQVHYDTAVIQTQKLLNQLQVSTLWVARILLLQLPLWTTFYLRWEMLASFSIIGWIFQILVTGAFAFAAWWFFVNIRYENIHRKWFRSLFGRGEWNVLRAAGEQLEAIRQLEKEEQRP